MSKNKVDRRESSFKARDNVEIIMDKVICLAEKEFTKGVEAQCHNVGTWEADGNVAKINIEVDTPFKCLENRVLILNCETNNRVNVTSEKEWLLKTFRQKLVDATFDLMEHVNIANGIYPITILEFDERRLNQDKAMTDCYHILHILQQAIHFLYLKPSKVEAIVGLIDEELRLLKGWRRSEYKKRNAILKRENRH